VPGSPEEHPASVKALKWQSEACYRYVRFGSEADMCSAKRHVCFTPNSDRESEISAKGHVCFTPESDIAERD
jgi:hypothetical protein